MLQVFDNNSVRLLESGGMDLLCASSRQSAEGAVESVLSEVPAQKVERIAAI